MARKWRLGRIIEAHMETGANGYPVSQAQVAHRIGVEPGTLSKWKRGDYPKEPSLTALAGVAKATQVPLDIVCRAVLLDEGWDEPELPAGWEYPPGMTPPAGRQAG